jgi:formylmethanofuran dehydrogenase subunit E
MKPKTDFDTYRSLGYLTTLDVIETVGLNKNELFHLLHTNFPFLDPIRVPCGKTFAKGNIAYMFYDKDVYVLRLIKRMKEKKSLQTVRTILNSLKRYQSADTLNPFEEENYKKICETLKEFGGELLIESSKKEVVK